MVGRAIGIPPGGVLVKGDTTAPRGGTGAGGAGISGSDVGDTGAAGIDAGDTGVSGNEGAGEGSPCSPPLLLSWTYFPKTPAPVPSAANPSAIPTYIPILCFLFRAPPLTSRSASTNSAIALLYLLVIETP